MPAYDPSREEIFHVAGDMDTGISTTADMTKGAQGHPQIRYSGKHGDYVMTADVYAVDGTVMVHLICPRCHNALSIKSQNKQIDWDPVNEVVSVERSQCTWELGHSDATKNDHMSFGIGLCRFSFAIDKNRCRDA